MLRTTRFIYPGIGLVHLKVHGTTMRITARWHGPELCVTVPAHCTAAHFEDFMTKMHSRLLALRPTATFNVGTIIDAPLVDFEIVRMPIASGADFNIVARTDKALRGKLANYAIAVSDRVDDSRLAEPAVQLGIKNNLLNAARHATARYIVPRARRLAAEVGASPAAWTVRSTHSRHGSCTSQGRISLSANLIFMPEELSDFVIYHELAHLTEMNHSEAFHRLCNSYCRGRESELAKKLKAFRLPFE
ncbi:MAG: M48 family metallopeptidase [Muribaculaceae bacterium]|nr:M48 family metallopeptidase [Muribaculaceae bacterium]